MLRSANRLKKPIKCFEGHPISVKAELKVANFYNFHDGVALTTPDGRETKKINCRKGVNLSRCSTEAARFVCIAADLELISFEQTTKYYG